MLRTTGFAFVVGLMMSMSAFEARATPNCMRDIKPFQLASDTTEWSMTIAPGANCIQGLRWSTMQIYDVSISEKPKSGELVLVGPGFRYFAKPGFTGTDTFALVVVGKNRHDEGTSRIQVTISPANQPIVVGSVNNPE